MNGIKSTSDSMYKDVDHTQLEVYEVVQTFLEVVVLNFLCGRYSKATSGANFQDFLFGFCFCFFDFYTKADIFHNKVLKILKRLPIPFGGCIKLHCTTFLKSFSFLFRPEFKQVDEQKKWKESAFSIKKGNGKERFFFSF